MAADPVCLMIIDEEDAKFTSIHKDEKYYFCIINPKLKPESRS